MRVSPALLLASVLVSASALAQPSPGDCQLGTATALLEANEVRAGLYNKGNLFSDGGAPTYEVPAGQGISPMFAAGLWIGGVVEGEVRIAAATYAQGMGDYEFWPGPLDDGGALPNPDDCSAYDRIWNVTRDQVRDYVLNGVSTPDLAEWPVGLGAPTCVDANSNVRCDPGEPHVEPQSREQVIDVLGGELPDLRGSDQGAFWVMNDVGNDHRTTGSDPVGIEARVLAYAYAAAPLRTTTFYDYELVYRGTAPLGDTFFAFFADPDLGDFADDYIGSAPGLGLGLVYNADNDDDEFAGGYGVAPPALGVDILRGPVVDADGDGDLDVLGMTRFGYFNNTTNPRTGNPMTASDFYGYMRGVWKDGTPWTEGGDGSGEAGTPVNFVYPNSGSPAGPVPGYWSEVCPQPSCSGSLAPDDRRFVASSGPFTMQPGDVQRMSVGIVWAEGSSNVASLQNVKLLDTQVQAFFDQTLPPVSTESGAPETGFALAGAFPNPFAERTTVPVELAEAGQVTAEVFDVLGRRVDVLFDGVLPAGERSLTWAPSFEVPSGVYVLRARTSKGTAATLVSLQR